MESKINLEEFILKQLDVSLTTKDRLESKAGMYLAIVTLTLTALLSFLSIIFNGEFSNEVQQLIFTPTLVVFCIGLLELAICASMIFPRLVWQFSIDKLMNVYQHKNSFDAIQIEQALLRENQHFIMKNESRLSYLRATYVVSSIGLILLMICFVILSSVFFYVISGGC